MLSTTDGEGSGYGHHQRIGLCSPSDDSANDSSYHRPDEGTSGSSAWRRARQRPRLSSYPSAHDETENQLCPHYCGAPACSSACSDVAMATEGIQEATMCGGTADDIGEDSRTSTTPPQRLSRVSRDLNKMSGAQDSSRMSSGSSRRRGQHTSPATRDDKDDSPRLASSSFDAVERIDDTNDSEGGEVTSQTVCTAQSTRELLCGASDDTIPDPISGGENERR